MPWRMTEFGTKETSLKEVVGGTVVGWIATNDYFENFFSACIVINCLMLGVQAHLDITGQDEAVKATQVVEILFTSIFALELLIKLKAFGIRRFSPMSRPNGPFLCVDAVLVLVTSAAVFVLPFVSAANDNAIQLVSMLRTLRLFRLVRVLHGVDNLRQVWMLLRGMTESVGILIWTMVVIAGVTYVFAVFGVVLIGNVVKTQQERSTDEAELARCHRLMPYVGGVDQFMLTLVQVLTLDSWTGILRDLLPLVSWCWIYFYLYVAFGNFVLMNLVTAIIVDNAITQSRSDEEDLLMEKSKQRKDALNKMESLFTWMDADRSGALSRSEFEDSFLDPVLAKKWQLLECEHDGCSELFHLLDTGTGEIAIQEFFRGLRKMKGPAMAKDVFVLHKEVQKLQAKLESVLMVESEVEERTQTL